MESEHRAVSFVSLAGFMTLLAMFYLMIGCVEKQNKISLERDRVEISLKMECLRNKGVWVPRDNDSRPPFVCKFQ